jgi:hypothetical protein
MKIFYPLEQSTSLKKWTLCNCCYSHKNLFIFSIIHLCRFELQFILACKTNKHNKNDCKLLRTNQAKVYFILFENHFFLKFLFWANDFSTMFYFKIRISLAFNSEKLVMIFFLFRNSFGLCWKLVLCPTVKIFIWYRSTWV